MSSPPFTPASLVNEPIGRRLKGEGPPPGGGRAPEAAGAPSVQAPDEPLVCARCAHPITREADRTEVDGSHLHSRINPLGYVFHFGCFSRAEGCLLVGPPTDEHSWFAGYAWQYAYCAACRAHLGWSFHGPGTFFGLILDRLARPS